MQTNDTIAAISTPPGEGAIGIVRLSGPEAIDMLAGVFQPARTCDVRAYRGRPLYGEIHDTEGPVDEVLVNIMHAPHTYTREDVVEINCHGGAGPVAAILELVLERGARLADPGEFTKRAFLNGRIDLVQAEAVIDRIQARTKAALRAADAAARGALSTTIHAMRDMLLDALAHVEAAIDFPDEDLPELVNDVLRTRLEQTREEMAELLRTADAGRLYREGVRVAIAGRPNVGKSSLFNALLRDARAIVTPHAGTTRDRLEETITIQGVPVRLSDTAGLRSSEDEIERVGIERARDALRTADAVLFVLSAEEPDTKENKRLAQELLDLDVPCVCVMNKIDLAPNPTPPAWAANMTSTVNVAAITNTGIHDLEAALAALLVGPHAPAPDQGMITRIHQRDSLKRANEALERLLTNYNASPEFLSIDLRDALNALGEITGDTTPEDILDIIFGSFCIGK